MKAMIFRIKEALPASPPRRKEIERQFYIGCLTLKVLYKSSLREDLDRLYFITKG